MSAAHSTTLLQQFLSWKDPNRAIEFLSRMYFSNIKNLPKLRPNNQIHVNLQCIICAYGYMSGISLEMKRTVQHTRWNFSWIILVEGLRSVSGQFMKKEICSFQKYDAYIEDIYRIFVVAESFY